MTAYGQKQTDILSIIDRAISAVAPEPAMQNALSIAGDTLTVAGEDFHLGKFRRVQVLGAGKASASMAHALEDILGDHLQGGMVVTKYGHGLDLKKTIVRESAHPVPDMMGEHSSGELLRMAREASEDDLVFCLLSGGASALIPAPQKPISLSHKQATTQCLLKCGASINEINAVRKHLSGIKGGHLAKALEPATVITLIISDVVGDNLDVIGSGPTAPDESTFQDCLDILEKYCLRDRIPQEVVNFFKAGAAGMKPETRKAGDSCFSRVRNIIIAGNEMALAGASMAARELGYTPMIINSRMQGEARAMARELILAANDFCKGKEESILPACLLAGGETTVTITGNGKGGRNQELALAAAIELWKTPRFRKRISVACVGTDGNDGPTDAAGALVLPDTLMDSAVQSARQHLADNNSYAFFTDTKTIIKTGPTRTNVMDIAVILVDPD